MPQTPAFIAFTGIDKLGLLPGLKSLSERYPIEWGVLVDDDQADKPLFPDAAVRAAFLAAGGLRLAAHVCGKQARRIANAPESVSVDLTGFQRIQVNHSFAGSTPDQVENTVRFGRRLGARTMLQCQDQFPSDSRLDWLFDPSFGLGVAPKAWPTLQVDGPFSGYSGGINPGNAAAVVEAIGAKRGQLYWIDMESGVRTENWLDLDKCEAVCRAVYG